MEKTTRMLKAYVEDTPTPLFMAGSFRSPSENYHDAEEVEWDVEREDEEVAIPLHRDAGYHMNEDGGFTNKKVIPPSYKEGGAISASSVGRIRTPGKDKYQDPGFLQEATARAVKLARKNEKKIRRSMELQASQLYTSVAGLDLKNTDGDTVFALDYKAKATHFPTAGTSWATASLDQKLNDIRALCDVVRDDGKLDPRRLLIGDDSYENLINTTTIFIVFDINRSERGQINPLPEAQAGTRGGQYRGTLDLGNFKLDVWTYGGRYKDPETGNILKFCPGSKVIVQTDGRMDATFGGMKNFNTFRAPIPFLRGRAMMTRQGIDMFFNNWLSPDGEVLNIGVSARPLLIPTAIDTYGCLDTGL